MDKTTLKILDLFNTKGSVLDALIGLTRVKIAKHEDPETCVYVRRAEAMFYTDEGQSFINKLKEIIDLYERRDGEV